MLEQISVAPELFEKFPDYSVALLKVTGVKGGASNDDSERLLQYAEATTRNFLATNPLDELPEVHLTSDQRVGGSSPSERARVP